MEHQALCWQDGCRNLGTKYCGACKESCYCSIRCQKGDWKLHRIWCNKMPTELIPASEVSNIQEGIQKAINAHIVKGNFLKCGPVMEKLLVFLEFQYGTKIPGKVYRMRDNIRMDDNCLLMLRLALGDMYCKTQNYEKALAHALEGHGMLIARIVEYKVDEDLLRYNAETLLCKIYLVTFDYPKAQRCGKLAVAIARRLSAVGQTTNLYDSLRLLAKIMSTKAVCKESLILSEEAYVVASGVHGPEHPDVQDAAAELIDYLMESGDFSLADDFARINYETLMSGSDPESYTSAKSMQQLARIWTEKPSDPTDDPEVGEEAERLIDRAIDIIRRTNPPDTPYLTAFLDTEMDVSAKKRNVPKCTRQDHETFVKDKIREFGVFNSVTFGALASLAGFYLRIAPSHGRPEFEIATMLFYWIQLIANFEDNFAENSDKDKILEKPAMLFEECIIEFLDHGLSTAMYEKSKAAITEYKIWERGFPFKVADQPEGGYVFHSQAMR